MIAIILLPKGNRLGQIAGLAAGTLIWFEGLLVPVFTGVSSFTVPGLDFTIPLGMQFWSGVALLSLGVNTSFFVGVSALTRQTEAEQYSAELCAADELSQPARQSLDVHKIGRASCRERAEAPTTARAGAMKR